jgi:hypothetical protein
MAEDLRKLGQDALHGAFQDQIRKLYANLCVEMGNADTDSEKDAAVQRTADGMRVAADALRRALQASDAALRGG